MVDVVKSNTSKTITGDVLASLPMGRAIDYVFDIAPGATAAGSIYGDGNGEQGFIMDGVQMVEPDVGGAYLGSDTGMAWDMVEEVQLVTAGASAEAYNSASGLVNVVTKSGGNKFSGELSVYYTDKNLVQVRIPEEDLKALGLAKPSVPIWSVDSSFSLGGPIIKDKIWFLGEFRYLSSKETGDFKPTVINGKQYNSYDRTYPSYIGFLKVSAQLAKNLRFFAMGHLSMQDVPYYYSGWNLTAEANYNNKPVRLNYSGTLSWIIDPNTILDARGGGLYFKWQGLYTKEADPNGPNFYDEYTEYTWNNPGGSQYTWKPKVFGSITLTRFQDNFLGGNHEFKAGLEVERNRGDWGFYMKNPLFWTYYNGNPYYFRGLYGIDHPDPVDGDGLLTFAAIGSTYGSSYESGITFRFGGFVQDSFTLKRLTMNLGLRFDTIKAWSPGRTKGAAGSPLAVAIGEAYFVPEFGINPYGEIKYDTWDNAFPYGLFLSPRVGLTYDLLGDGKTAIKATFSRQQEGFLTGSFSSMYPLTWRSFSFRWWDLNNNVQPDLPGIDRYETFGESPLAMVSKAYLNAIDPNVKVPYVNEITLGIEHELLKDFKISARYINKDRKRVLASVLYDQESQRYWYAYERATDWWIPFTTTIPAYGDYPAQTVTMYFQSNSAPDEYRRLTNIPEGKMKYRSIEFSFDKRMSNGWQLGGSVNFSKSTGNYRVSYASWASSWVFSNPNAFVNADGELPYSRPVMIKLYGTFNFPYDILVSLFYQHVDGSPWGRTVEVRPPTAWAEAHSTRTWSYDIQVETRGTRRNQSRDSLDLRLEKDFPLGPGKLGLYVDIFNLLGMYSVSTEKNPGGIWLPTDANTTEGVFTPGWAGLTDIYGSRLFKISVFYRF
jgi:hypothetical protein